MNGARSGGNMNAVSRVGNTVRRQAGPWTPTVHRYLRYLARNGVDWAPTPIGSEAETEILSYVEGMVPEYPLPAWVWDEAVLVDGARMLRQLHDASIGFGIDDAVWQSPTKIPSEVVCHNDFAPHNLAFNGEGRITGAIDFDMCSPGPRIWDIAYFATRACPLTALPPDGAPGPEDARGRIQLLLREYGSDASWKDVVRVAVTRLLNLAEFSVEKADELFKPHLRAEAVAYERDAKYLAGWL
ncbi:phosphotransferase [Mycetocola miduiensis]|uniref:Phosphotransferase enzyme family protein n=1 Tax=Mycetocola miduiensis TaxID=995034 RepID=A0A1I5BTG8_9MICO|nr:phosphotransferase [Mycetocola miduiensis]SFN77938.1 Phosphotransferase enzyme family protein [Mycetocola miduiensis]